MTEQMIKVGYNSNFAPLTYEADGKAKGIVIDKISSIAGNAGFDVDYFAATLSELLPALENGKLDMLSALADTPSRRGKYLFRKPLLITGASWFAPLNRQFGQSDVPRSIVTPERGPLVSQIENEFPNVEISTTEDYDDALQKVLYGDSGAEAAALNWHVGSMLVNEKYRGLFHVPNKPFNQMALAIAAPKEDPKGIIEKLNNQIPDEWGKIEVGDFR